MTERNQNEGEREIDQFILDEIDSVPQLEALLLLWNSRPVIWTPEELARRLYVSTELSQSLLQELVRKRLITRNQGSVEGYRYESVTEETDGLIGGLDNLYRREVVRVSTVIHAKPSSAVRDFARAFRFTKERE
ncbi:MAG: hypothetical protein ACRD3P_12885 [Terriglobales bacterium]